MKLRRFIIIIIATMLDDALQYLVIRYIKIYDYYIIIIDKVLTRYITFTLCRPL